VVPVGGLSKCGSVATSQALGSGAHEWSRLLTDSSHPVCARTLAQTSEGTTPATSTSIRTHNYCSSSPLQPDHPRQSWNCLVSVRRHPVLQSQFVPGPIPANCVCVCSRAPPGLVQRSTPPYNSLGSPPLPCSHPAPPIKPSSSYHRNAILTLSRFFHALSSSHCVTNKFI
jgi:hypothetical protein